MGAMDLVDLQCVCGGQLHITPITDTVAAWTLMQIWWGDHADHMTGGAGDREPRNPSPDPDMSVAHINTGDDTR